MKSIFFYYIFTIFLFAGEYKIIFAESTPPYVFKNGDGIVQSIVKEALAHKGHSIMPIFLSIARGKEMLDRGYVDGSTIIKESSGVEAFYSDDYMEYNNVAIALSNKNLKIEKIGDLKKFHILAFQNAKFYLEQEFCDLFNRESEKYKELADQKTQVQMLFSGRVDVIVMDINIFHYYRNQLISEKKVLQDTKYDVFKLFQPTKYKSAFKSQNLRDDFNEGIKFLKESGRYEQIYEYYTKLYDMKNY